MKEADDRRIVTVLPENGGALDIAAVGLRVIVRSIEMSPADIRPYYARLALLVKLLPQLFAFRAQMKYLRGRRPAGSRRGLRQSRTGR